MEVLYIYRKENYMCIILPTTYKYIDACTVDVDMIHGGGRIALAG